MSSDAGGAGSGGGGGAGRATAGVKRRRAIAGIDDVEDAPDAEALRRQQRAAAVAAAAVGGSGGGGGPDDGPDSDSSLESEGEGDDLIEDQEADYQAMPELDRYEEQHIDNREYGLDLEARRRAEEDLDRQDGGRRRGMEIFDDDAEAEVDDSHRDKWRAREERQAYELEDDLWDTEGLVLENFDVPLRQWIATDRPRREIARRFRLFLNHFDAAHAEDELQRLMFPPAGAEVHRLGHGGYVKRIEDMCGKNKQSCEVSYLDLSKAHPTLAIWLADAPQDMLAVFDEVLLGVVRPLAAALLAMD